MPNNPSSDGVDVLTKIWKRVFQRESIYPNENFLSLGGDAEKACTIATEVNSQLGREISPLLVLQSATISSLAHVLAKTELPSVRPVLRLNDASQSPPIFIAHGIGNTVLDLLRLAANLQSEFAIYGLQTPGFDGLQQPLESVEEMAEYHVPAIRQIQPHGPYFLIGYSLGGIVALEIARALSDAGEEIGFLAMLDSYPDRRYLPLGLRIRWEWSQMGRRSSDMWKRAKRLSSSLGSRRHLSGAHQSVVGLPEDAVLRTKAAQTRALRNYRPRYYNGEATFVKASLDSYYTADPVAIWGGLVTQLEVERIRASHVDILNSQVENVASLVRCLLPETRNPQIALKRAV